MGETDGHLEGPGSYADLRTDGYVAGSGLVVEIGQAAVAVAQVDVHVRAAEVADCRVREGTDEADPHVLLLKQQRRRMRVDDAAEVALGAGLPVRGCLHVEAEVGKLRREGGRDQERVFFGVGEDLLGQSVLVVGGVDFEGRHARAEPGNGVLAIGGVVNRRSTAGGDEKTQFVKRDVVEKGEKDLAEAAAGERVPDLASRTGGRPEGHLATRPPHRRRAWSAGSIHRLLSMERAWGG